MTFFCEGYTSFSVEVCHVLYAWTGVARRINQMRSPDGLWQAADLGLSAPGRSGLARDGEEDVALNLISNHKKENQGAKGRKTPGCKFSWISSIYPCQESGSNGGKKGFEALLIGVEG